MHIETDRLTLVLETPQQVRARIEQMSPDDKAQLSAEWLARIDALTEADPWTHGFALVERASGQVVGQAGFKGPPSDGVAEIAYRISPEYQGRGYATEAAAALSAHALRSGEVRIVRAHTLPELNASTRVLTRCGFQRVGEVIDPDDGLVWRWEKVSDSAEA